MTFCVAVGRSYIGLVAADTRSIVPDTEVFSDSGELRFKNPLGGPSIELKDQFRKIRRLGNVWITGAGVLQWNFLAYRELERCRVTDVHEAAKVLSNFSTKAMPVFANTYPESVLPIKERTAIIFVQPDSEKSYHSHYLDWHGYGAPDIGVFCASPTDDDEFNKDLMRRYEGQFAPDWYAQGFHDALRATAAIFLEVYHMCGENGAVSSVLEIGLSRRSRGGRQISQHLAPTPCEKLIGATDGQIDRMLNAVN